MALSFFYQPVRISVRFTQNYVENRVLAPAADTSCDQIECHWADALPLAKNTHFAP